MRDSRAREKEDDKQDKGQIPRVVGMCNGRGGGSNDASRGQRLLLPGPQHEGRSCRDGNDGLHDAARLRCFVSGCGLSVKDELVSCPESEKLR